MFAILNRFRGTKAYWAKIAGVILGIIFGLATGSWLIGINVAVMYVLGESFGWGKWIGGMMSNNCGPATRAQLIDREGEAYGIHQLANWIAPETENYYIYCAVALGIRGFYWFAIAFLPLVVMGTITVPVYMLAAVALGVAFPVAVMIGEQTAEKFDFEFGFFNMKGTWEHAEVWYGLAQDFVIFVLLIAIL